MIQIESVDVDNDGSEFLRLQEYKEFVSMDTQQTANYAVGWTTLALINAGLAQPKGRSGLAWFLVSLLLGPVATFLIVALEPIREESIG